MMNCTADGCDEEAAFRLFWPGRNPIAKCEAHMAQAQRVAEAMGFYVYAERMSPPVSLPHPDPSWRLNR